MKNLLYVLMIVSVAMTACSKEGPEGPEGPQGIQGETGPAGADGSVIISGEGTPAVSLGSEGDYYLDKTAVMLYGPKTASGWGTGLSLQGEQGDPGSQILAGDGEPDGTMGIIGDYYVDTTNYLFYGPKHSVNDSRLTSWGGGLQLGFPAESYIFTDPYAFTVNYAIGALKIPQEDCNLNDEEIESALILAYINVGNTWYFATGEINQPATYKAKFWVSAANNGCAIYLQQVNGTNWTSQAAFEGATNISKIKIIVIPASKVETISALPDKSYPLVMSVLSNNACK
ncbi:MAG: hypothetical protein JXQ80_09315 [Bacteroidales bacterium]|nr:hypothetical protein [Bacteroidales bacterium]